MIATVLDESLSFLSIFSRLYNPWQIADMRQVGVVPFSPISIQVYNHFTA